VPRNSQGMDTAVGPKSKFDEWANSAGLQAPTQERRDLRCVNSGMEDAMGSLTKKDQGERSKINMHDGYEVKYWTHALGVSKEQLLKAVSKVGNSAAAVRKELETS
jgi:uncharacterized protein DUF3606